MRVDKEASQTLYNTLFHPNSSYMAPKTRHGKVVAQGGTGSDHWCHIISFRGRGNPSRVGAGQVRAVQGRSILPYLMRWHQH